MRSLLFLILITVCLSFGFSLNSFAVCGGGPTVFTCNTAPPNPDPTGIQQAANNSNLTINVQPGAGIDTINGNGGDAIEYGGGSNEITITNANISAQNDGINAFMNLGRATIHIEGSTMTTIQDVIDFGNVDGNILTIINSTLRTTGAGTRVINSGQNDDTINISGSTLTVLDGQVIFMRDGDDDLTLSNTVIEDSGFGGGSVELGNDNDTLTLLNGVVIQQDQGGNELINCGEGNDQIVFAMNVPQRFLAEVKAEIAAATVPSGSITINGLFYDWEECELLVDELQAGPAGVVRPIPTLSEWGLITMAAFIGIAGVMFIVRKRAAA